MSKLSNLGHALYEGTVSVPCPHPECTTLGVDPFYPTRIFIYAGCLQAPSEMIVSLHNGAPVEDSQIGVRCARKVP